MARVVGVENSCQITAARISHGHGRPGRRRRPLQIVRRCPSRRRAVRLGESDARAGLRLLDGRETKPEALRAALFEGESSGTGALLRLALDGN